MSNGLRRPLLLATRSEAGAVTGKGEKFGAWALLGVEKLMRERRGGARKLLESSVFARRRLPRKSWDCTCVIALFRISVLDHTLDASSACLASLLTKLLGSLQKPPKVSTTNGMNVAFSASQVFGLFDSHLCSYCVRLSERCSSC